MRPVSRPISTAKIAVRSDDKARHRRQTILALAAASAIALCSIGMARADTWVTVGPDGSVTRTVTNSAAYTHGQEYHDDTHQAVYPPVATVPQQNVQFGSGHTTLFSGVHYPIPVYPAPYAYPYYNPGGVTYPIGPPIPGFSSPTITTLPSTGYVYGYPGYVHPGYPYPSYPAPVYSYPYPLYGTTGTYYSGPIGGGGTIYSSSTTTNKGYGIGVGSRGWKLKGGNQTRSSTSTTTVTTSR